MDVLASLEPQLAIPVIVVVVGAVLVYMFGFKQTEEPSYEHLAILQSSNYKNRSGATNNPKQTKTSVANSASSKPKTNGQIPTANGVAKKATTTTTAKVEVNKENKPPQVKASQKKGNLKDPSNKPEDFESGEWIPAVSRKEKTKKKETVKAEQPSSPGKKTKVDYSAVMASSNGSIPVAAAVTAAGGTVTKAPKIEDLLAEMKVLKEIEAQKLNNLSPPETTKAQTTPEKKAKEAKPKKEKAAEVVAKEEVKEAPSKPEVKAPEEPKQDFKTNIAFDEMGGGDTWEEAKSRGAKKRRARKD